MVVISSIPLILMMGGLFLMIWTVVYPPKPKTIHRYRIGQDVIFVNVFGVCWGIKKIIGLDMRSGRPTYYISPTDSPWYSTCQTHLLPVEKEDYSLTAEQLQGKYGFKPTEYFGCY